MDSYFLLFKFYFKSRYNNIYFKTWAGKPNAIWKDRQALWPSETWKCCVVMGDRAQMHFLSFLLFFKKKYFIIVIIFVWGCRFCFIFFFFFLEYNWLTRLCYFRCIAKLFIHTHMHTHTHTYIHTQTHTYMSEWKLLSRVQFFATQWPIQSMEFCRPGQNTGVGSYSLLQGIFPTQDQTQVFHIAGRFFTIWPTREAQAYWSG